MTTTTEHTQPGTTAPPVHASDGRGRAWPLVALREIQVRLTDRNFLMSTGLTLVLLIGMMAFQAFMSGGSASYTVAVDEPAGGQLVHQAEEDLQSGDPEATLEAVEVTDRDAGEALVSDGEADALLTRADDGWQLVVDGEADSTLQATIADTVRSGALAGNAEQAGVSMAELTAGTELTSVDLTGADPGSDMMTFIIGFVFALLFYMSSLMFGMAIAGSVVEEKQSRIVEILAAMIPVRQLLVGKVLGTTAIALGQLVLIIGVGLVGLTLTDFDVVLPGLAGAIGWYVPFFLAGFLALACIWAAAGSLASRQEDLQSTSTPLTIVLVGVLFVGFALEGTAQVVGSFVPVLSTIMMPMRLLEGGVAWWEPTVALLLTLAFCAVTIGVGTRLYQRSLLQTQGRMSWRAAWRATG